MKKRQLPFPFTDEEDSGSEFEIESSQTSNITILEDITLPLNKEILQEIKEKNNQTPKKQNKKTHSEIHGNELPSTSSPRTTYYKIKNFNIIYGNNQQTTSSSGLDSQIEKSSTPIKKNQSTEIYGNNQLINRSPSGLDSQNEKAITPTGTASTSTDKGKSRFKTEIKFASTPRSTPRSKRSLPFQNETPIKKSRSAEVSPNKSSPIKKNLKNDFITKPEDEKFNLKQLDCLKEIFESTLNDKDKRRLLKETETKVIEEFLGMNVYCQYFLIKLFLYLPKWYHFMDFSKKIRLDHKISPQEINEIYNSLKVKQYIDTDLKVLDIDTLLNMVSRGDLISLCKGLKVNGRKSNKKDDMIKVLKENCRTQRNFSGTKSRIDLLKERVLNCLGFQMKLKENIKRAFEKAYLIQVFTNPNYIDPYKYMNDKLYSNVDYPDYKVENYNVFLDYKNFASYYEAVFLKKNYFDNAQKNNYNVMKILADEAFTKLSDISPHGKCPSYVSDHLRKFSAEYQYISILTAASQRLLKFHENVKTWLEFLIENYRTHYALGCWYKQLAHIYLRYLKDPEEAARVTSTALEFDKEKNSFNLLQKYELSIFATKIWNSKSYNVSKLLRDKLCALAETPVNIDDFVKITITSCTDRKSKVGKRIYSFINEEGERNYGDVEIIAINHYRSEEYEGRHLEGRLLEILFVLFFWDIIYEYYVPNTFISKHQNCPLDMFTKHFYTNRKDEIETRLKEIAESWPQEDFEKTLRDNWTAHSHEDSITKLEGVIKEEDLLKMLKCINRKVLAKILERMAADYKCFRSGFPDLFLWRTETNECKFVEVKGENDRLSSKQILWIKYLTEIKASVEVCHVSGVGAKEIKPSQTEENLESSTG